ncbi:MAG: MerR family DNA-binding transcriptional regulator [Peptococcaceae bacterium]|nr:MerR family DNA-binding transcriptional regulator [Peptococcaceae bacterium]
MAEKKKDIYTISDLASEFGISTRTIRYYEEVGLLSPTRTGESTPRLYTRKDRGRLKLILRGKRFGFTLQEIKEMLDLYSVDPGQKEQLRRTIEYGDRRIAEIDEMIRDLTLLKEEMLEFRKKFIDMLNEGPPGD